MDKTQGRATVEHAQAEKAYAEAENIKIDAELKRRTMEASVQKANADAGLAKLKEMQALFQQEAEKYGVMPLDNSGFARAVAPRPSTTAGQTVFKYSGKIPGIPNGNAPSIIGKSYTITADVVVPQNGGDGMIVSQGGRWGGYALYVLEGKPVFLYNMLMLAKFRWVAQKPLTAGTHAIVFDFTYDGPGIAKGGTGVLKVDGEVVATQQVPNTIAFLMVADESFNVGVDTGTPVNDQDYQVPFEFTGTLSKLTVNLGPMQLMPLDHQHAAKAVAVAND